MALSYFAVGLLRQVCRPGGLGEKHFGWQSNWRLMLYRNLSWLMVLGLPMRDAMISRLLKVAVPPV